MVTMSYARISSHRLHQNDCRGPATEPAQMGVRVTGRVDPRAVSEAQSGDVSGT